MTAGATLRVELDGNSPGTGSNNYDQLIVGGTNSGGIFLNNATLNATLGYTFEALDRFFIVVNNNESQTVESMGIFNGLPHGATFNLSGHTAYIYYTGQFQINDLSGGNDVVITFVPIPEPASVLLICGIGAAVGGLAYRRYRKPSLAAA
jgi:hypothetical protein